MTLIKRTFSLLDGTTKKKSYFDNRDESPPHVGNTEEPATPSLFRAMLVENFNAAYPATRVESPAVIERWCLRQAGRSRAFEMNALKILLDSLYPSSQAAK
jgi:hypothetical protein